MQRIAGWRLQYSSRSLAETSARLPIETNIETPRLMWSACASSASPMAPDCETKATGPGCAKVRENEALRRTSSSVFWMPMQLGPTMRMPALRAVARMRASASAPCAPVSLKPAVITTTAPTPFLAHCSIARGTPSLGIVITARSTGSSIAVTAR